MIFITRNVYYGHPAWPASLAAEPASLAYKLGFVALAAEPVSLAKVLYQKMRVALVNVIINIAIFYIKKIACAARAINNY